MIRGKTIYLHCPDGQRSALEQKSRNLGANPVCSPNQSDVIYVVAQSAGAEEIRSYRQHGKPVIHVNEDLIDQDLMGKILSGRVRVRDAERER